MVEDHERARRLARLASIVPGLRVVEPETNIVMMDVTVAGVTAVDVTRALAEHEVLVTPFTTRRVRAVTHLDITDEGLSHAAEALAHVMAALAA